MPRTPKADDTSAPDKAADVKPVEYELAGDIGGAQFVDPVTGDMVELEAGDTFTLDDPRQAPHLDALPFLKRKGGKA